MLFLFKKKTFQYNTKNDIHTTSIKEQDCKDNDQEV